MTYAGDAEYKRMLSESFGGKACEAEETCGEFLVLPKCEHIEETLVVGEEIVVDENLEMNQQAETVESKEARLFFQEEGDPHRVDVEFVECGGPMAMGDEGKGWEETDEMKQLPLVKEEGEIEGSCTEMVGDDQDGDEETIATFVTAAGQQLALYAVEDSEEIFAVAVYDESGEPPTNFQFLMKADVERLIGEGAVRTVKKPTQIKKQLLTTQPPLFFPKAESLHHAATNDQQKIVSHENQRLQRKENSWHDDSDLLQEDLSLDVKPVPNIIYATGDKQSDVAYLMMDNCSVNIDGPVDTQEDAESDVEFVEQSTVQYILFEGDQSDSELTFDEIQATLQNLKHPKPRKATKRLQREHTILSRPTDYDPTAQQTPPAAPGGSRCAKTLAERRLNFLESRQELLDTLGDSPSEAPDTLKLDLSGESTECASPESAQARFRTKRPRKQQLTSVNREDSEIIIQPASLLSEEDTGTRKRGKRKRRVVTHGGYGRGVEAKRSRRSRRKEVEIIELDVEEEEKRDVVEITIDDSKDKYSSDKENEIIMVGDSDEESQQADAKSGLLQCQHCARNFRQQRALETHLRVCSKSPSNAVRFAEQRGRQQGREGAEKKQYACKVCQTKFDVVVALARHVRSEHSQRKKRRFSKSSMEQEPEEPPPEEKKGGLGVIERVRRKGGQKRPNCSWEVKKLSCTDCGRWFPSAALLSAHCLQHGTKKSEQQIRRCQICKKLIKSRHLFIRHLKKHSSAQQASSKPVPNMQKKLHTTRSVTRKITLRKRGRPRKL